MKMVPIFFPFLTGWYLKLRQKSPKVAIVGKSQKWLSVQMLAIWDSLALFGKLTKKNLDSLSLSSFISMEFSNTTFELEQFKKQVMKRLAKYEL